VDLDPHLELDGDVEFDPIVDLDLDPRFEEFLMFGRSMCKVGDGVDDYVAVKGKVLGRRRRRCQPQRLPEVFPASILQFFSRRSAPARRPAAAS
jgi:hypothetical protein